MKNKLICVASIFFTILAAIVFTYIDGGVHQARIHQHRRYESIPDISIDTGGADIPGTPEYVPDSRGVAQWKRYVHDNDETVTADFTYQDGEDLIASKVNIHVRGNSSRYFVKKSYSLHFVEDDGSERALSFSDMGACNEWALYGPCLDRTLIRNYMCMNICGEVMNYAPNVRFVNLSLDGEPRGLYVLMETVKRDEARLKLTKSSAHNRVTSYIVKLDRQRPIMTRVDSFSKYTMKTGSLAFDLCYPGDDQISDGKLEYVAGDLSRIEKELYSYDLFGTKGVDYTYDIDISEFARYFVLNEFFGNMDAGFYSTYFYKDTRGQIRPCVWDFNNACDNYIDQANGVDGFKMQYAPWMERLVMDPRFTDEIIRQYGILRDGVLSEAYLQSYITETLAWLGDAIDDNYAIWDDIWDYSNKNSYLKETNYLNPLERNSRNYKEAVLQLRNYLTDRGNWLDHNINNIRQYSHESRTINERLQ